MQTLELPRITTFTSACTAMAAFDAAYWTHAPGLPTIRHTMIHLCRSMDDKPSMDPLALSGLALEHALRLANVIGDSSKSFDFEKWFFAQRFILRLEYVEDPGEMNARNAHAELNRIVHDMEEGATLESVHASIRFVRRSLLYVAILARQYAHGPTPMTPVERWSAFADRLVYLYAKHDVTVTFVP